MNYPRRNPIYLGLYFSIQSNKIRKSEIFTSFEKICRSSINNLKSEETKNQIKAHLSYLANYYFYNYKPSPRILRQHRVLRNLRKNKDIVITKPDKGNGVVILDRKFYDSAIQEIIADTSKFERFIEDPTSKREALLQRFLILKMLFFANNFKFCTVKKDYKNKNIISYFNTVKMLFVSKSCLKKGNVPHFLYIYT